MAELTLMERTVLDALDSRIADAFPFGVSLRCRSHGGPQWVVRAMDERGGEIEASNDRLSLALVKAMQEVKARSFHARR